MREDIVAIASRVGSSLRRQSERDNEIVEAVLRVLTRPNNRRLGDQLRAAIKDQQ